MKDRMRLLSLLADVYLSSSEVNSQRAPLKKLSSQKSPGIIQRDHFDRAVMIEPLNLPLVDVSAHNPAVCQNERLPADSLETHSMNCPWREAQLSGETCVDDK